MVNGSAAATSANIEPIRILHLSDFHLREKTRWDSVPVLDGLADTVGRMVADGLKPDVVAITGDVAFSGRAAEYEQARGWIDEGLLPVIRPRFPRKNLLIVPGNHDVDRREVKTIAETVQSGLLQRSDQNAIADVLGDDGQRSMLLNRHDAYLDFANGLRNAKTQLEAPWWSTILKVRGVSVHFAGLCSSWMSCGDADYGRLLLGRWQVNAVLRDSAKADWSVALLHHPWSYAAEFDQRDVEARIHHTCHVVLRGHLHQQKEQMIRSSTEVCLELAAGSCYAGGDYPNAFQLVELYPEKREVRVLFWKWQGTKWIRDRNVCPDEADGVAMFPLAADTTETAATSPPPSIDASAYLRVVSERTSHIDIRGLMVGSGRAPRFPIEDLYIPLTTTGLQRDRLHGTRGDDEAEAWEARGSVRTELHEALKNRRLVIIGDPGSGKTTFLRRIAWLLCQTLLGVRPDAARSDLGLDGRPFPLLIRLSDLGEHIATVRKRNEGPIGRDTPAWLSHFLATAALEDNAGLSQEFFQSTLEDGSALVLLDGLDEAPSDQDRKLLSSLVEKASQAFSKCRFVLTSRPVAYRGDVLLPNFAQVEIDALENDAIETFLKHWCESLFVDTPSEIRDHLEELLFALQARADIRRLARNPVMLTALAVVHWNEKRLPEQRADLYESIIGWLARARERRPGRPSPDRCVTLHQELALAMQDHPDGRQVQIPRFDAARAISQEWQELPENQRTKAAENFLIDDELDSGIVVARGDHVRFWHLTFQEYLAARALASRSEDEQASVLLDGPKLYRPEWREVALLLAGVLYYQGRRRVDAMFSTVLGQLERGASLAEQARCYGLLGAAVQDLSPVNYQPGNPRYQEIADSVLGIFDRTRSKSVDIQVAIEAAEALGQAGDPRLNERKIKTNWIEIPAGEFWMGSQNEDPSKQNHDPDAYDNESPVHKVSLDAYRIGKYPVTVAEYRRFVESGGYQEEQYWSAGGFEKEKTPGGWDDQLQHPNRPVTDVSWYEASAYAAWAGCRLPTEAQWERAARGTEARKYPWGDEEISKSLANYSDSKVGCPTPVGVYPRGATPDEILDMAGNVLEWCQDWWSEAYSPGDVDNPTGPAKGDRRVFRGGCYDSDSWGCRGAFRYGVVPSSRNVLLGFRLVGLVAARTQKRKS